MIRFPFRIVSVDTLDGLKKDAEDSAAMATQWRQKYQTLKALVDSKAKPKPRKRTSAAARAAREGWIKWG